MWLYAASIGVILAYFLINTWLMFQSRHEFDILLALHFLSFVLIIALTVMTYKQYSGRLGKLFSTTKQYPRNQHAEEPSQLNHLLNNLPCAAATISPNFTIKTVNKAVTRLTGFTAEAALDQKCYLLFGDKVDICPGCPVRVAYQTGMVQQNLKSEKTATGEDIFIEQTAIPIIDSEGHIRHVLEIAIDATRRIRLENEKGQLFVQTVGALSKLVESRDYYTGTHSLGVEALAIEIGRELGLESGIISDISIAALLHDIGKIGILESILNKPGKLTPEEYTIIQRHPVIGYDTLKNIQPLQKIAEDILHHHERFDGHGYPHGKKGEEIPLVARILSVADVYEAITSDRVYRKAMTFEQAYQLMLDGRGTQFDPYIVDALFNIIQTTKKAN